MRPKVVLAIMLVAVGALGLMVILKGILQPRQVGPQPVAATTDSNQTEVVKTPASPSRTEPVPAVIAPTNVPVVTASNPQPTPPPITNVVATTPAEDRQASVNKDLDQIKESLLLGASNPGSLTAVRDRLLSPEPEVRKAAVVAAMHLNDRGAIPILKRALEQVKDTREKVAILDTIEYLQIPESNEQIPKSNEQITNAPDLDLPRN